MHRRLILAAVACWAALACTARASVTYSYQVLDANNNGGNFNLAPGQSVTLDVYLEEALTAGSTSLIVNPGGGLFDGAARVTQQGTSTATAITAKTGATPTTASAPIAGDLSATSAGLGFLQTSTTVPAYPTGGTAIPAGSTNLFYLLGTITISAATNATPGSVVTYATSPLNSADGNTTSFTGPAPNGFFDLDITNNDGLTYSGTIDNPTTFTVTVTPEPNGLVLSGMVASCGLLGGLGYVGYRRRKALLLKGNAAA